MRKINVCGFTLRTNCPKWIFKQIWRNSKWYKQRIPTTGFYVFFIWIHEYRPITLNTVYNSDVHLGGCKSTNSVHGMPVVRAAIWPVQCPPRVKSRPFSSLPKMSAFGGKAEVSKSACWGPHASPPAIAHPSIARRSSSSSRGPQYRQPHSPAPLRLIGL